MEQTQREELLELTNTALNYIRKIGGYCTERLNIRIIRKTAKYLVWIKVALEWGDKL